jgi:hypothetical protein
VTVASTNAEAAGEGPNFRFHAKNDDAGKRSRRQNSATDNPLADCRRMISRHRSCAAELRSFMASEDARPRHDPTDAVHAALTQKARPAIRQ